MEERELFWQTRLAEVCERKDNDLKLLQKSLNLSEHNNRQFAQETEANCKYIHQLQTRCKILDTMQKLSPSLETLLSTLKGDSIGTLRTDCGKLGDQGSTPHAMTTTTSDQLSNQNTNSGSLSDSGYNIDSDNTSPLQNLARTFRRKNMRHFSISEDDDDDENNIKQRDKVLRKLQSQRNSELYL